MRNITANIDEAKTNLIAERLWATVYYPNTHSRTKVTRRTWDVVWGRVDRNVAFQMSNGLT